MKCLLSILLSSMMAYQTHTVDLPFSDMDLPNEVTVDQVGMELRTIFEFDVQTFWDIPDAESLESVINQRIFEAGVTYLSASVLSFPEDNNDEGEIEFFFLSNQTPDIRILYLLCNGEGGSQITQPGIVPESVTLYSSSSMPMFPSSYDQRTITMSGGVSGVTYSLYCDGTLISHATCTGGTISFGTVSSPGVYTVRRPEGYQVGGTLTLNLFDVFVQGLYDAVTEEMISAPADGGYATAVLSLDREPDEEELEQLESWYDDRQSQVSFWPSLGQDISLTFNDVTGELTVSLMCPPNLGDDIRTYDTGMLLFGSNPTTLTLTQNGGGQLLEFNLEGDQTSSGGVFTINMSGSQLGVSYRLILNGETVRNVTGTGEPMSFTGLTRSGEYSMVASYGLETLEMTDTYTASVSDEVGGASYVATDTYTGEGLSCYTDITYYGGLGYPMQEVLTSFAGHGKDLVRGIVYDYMRRPDAQTLLPYVRSGINSHYDPNHRAAQTAYYAGKGFGNGQYANSINIYEDSPNGRLIRSIREGDIYRTAGRYVNYTYLLNVQADSVLNLVYHPRTPTSSSQIIGEGFHQDGSLRVLKTISEDRDTAYVFLDSKDKTILSRQVCGGENHDTYYIYDLRDSLVCVMQPMGTSHFEDRFTLDGDFAEKWCFTYTYDAYGNLVERHVPGSGLEVMAYDRRGRLVLYSDELMRLSGKYRYILYDNLDRVTEEGHAGLDRPLAAMRTLLYEGNNLSGYLTLKVPMRICTYYMDTSLPQGFMEEEGVVELDDLMNVRCLTMLRTEKVWEDPYMTETGPAASTYWRERTYFYDGLGRTVQVLETDSDGWTSRYSTAYDYTGNVVSFIERHYNGIQSDWMRCDYTYDIRGRLLQTERSIDGQQFATLTYNYDDMGRLTGKSADGRVSESYSYNIQGWRTSQSVDLYGQTGTFVQNLSYYSPMSALAQPRFGGFISEAVHSHLEQESIVTLYSYDTLGRLRDSHDTGGNGEVVTYDLNGNISLLDRIRNESLVDDLAFVREGNRSLRVMGPEFSSTLNWWPDGNLRIDSRKNLQFCYNFSNLLSALFVGSTAVTPSAIVVYLLDGTKAKALSADGTGLVYRGSFVYRRTADGAQSVESVAHDEGRMLAVQGASGTEFIDTWHVRDYLGSVRAVYDITQEAEDVTDVASVILEQNDYYAFGGRIDDPTQPIDQENRYRFNGKEQLRFDGIGLDPNLTDYGARYYESRYARWTTPDPLADKYYSTSPYAFCNNNPVNFVDPDGKYIETIWDVVSISIGVKNLRQNIKAGNIKAAVGDGVGILIDGLAAVIPVIPGGVGATRTVGKVAINAADGAIDAAKAADTAKDAGKVVKNPFGSKGKLDHRNKVEELVGKAKKELRLGESIEMEKKIIVGGSNRRPDVQIIGTDKKTRKVFEAERHPESKRNRLREEEYDRLGIEHETHSLN